MESANNYLTQLFSLKDKVAVVTGGMGRLGTEFTKALAQSGAKVAIFDIVDTPNQDLLDLSLKYPIKFLQVNIRIEAEVERAVKIVEDVWGIPNLLVNNAGWRASPNEKTRVSVPFENYPMDVWDEVFSINTTAAAICAKIVGGRLIKAKQTGTIINIASHYGLVSADQRIYDYREKIGKDKFVKDASYGASKAALVALTRDLATLWAPFGIRVVALAPGGVFNPKSDPEFVANYSARVPMGRMANIDEYNGAIVFLASDAASYMTGNCLVIDGGWTSW